MRALNEMEVSNVSGSGIGDPVMPSGITQAEWDAFLAELARRNRQANQQN